jgi:hypothetical protein
VPSLYPDHGFLRPLLPCAWTPFWAQAARPRHSGSVAWCPGSAVRRPAPTSPGRAFPGMAVQRAPAPAAWRGANCGPARQPAASLHGSHARWPGVARRGSRLARRALRARRAPMAGHDQPASGSPVPCAARTCPASALARLAAGVAQHGLRGSPVLDRRPCMVVRSPRASLACPCAA